MTTFGIFCLEARKILEGSEKDRFLRMPRWFAIVEFFLGHADAAFLSWHTAKVKVVKFKAALTKRRVPFINSVSRRVVREGKQKRKKKKKKKKGREEEEEGERKGGEASLSLSLRHVYRSICLLLVQGPISQRTALLHSRVRSPRGNAASKPWLPWLPSPSRSRALCSTRTWCLQTRRKKASTTSRHRADCNDQIFLCGFTPSEWTGTNCDEPGFQTSYRKPRWLIVGYIFLLSPFRG